MFVCYCDKCGDSIYSDDEMTRNGHMNMHIECADNDDCDDCDGSYDDAM